MNWRAVHLFNDSTIQRFNVLPPAVPEVVWVECAKWLFFNPESATKRYSVNNSLTEEIL
jgi:hypothetical protein